MTDSLKQGWLSPTGEFFSCGSYDHLSLARDLSEPLLIPDIDPQTLRKISADDKLLDSGWVYIGISSFLCHEYRISWKRFLTDNQKNFLRPYFEQDYLPVNSVSSQMWEEESYL